MEALIGVAFLATLGERLAEVLAKPFLTSVPEKVTRLVCAIPGFVLVLLSGYDAFAAVGIQFPYVSTVSLGILVTALVAGFGANFVHDTFDRVRNSTMIFEAVELEVA